MGKRKDESIEMNMAHLSPWTGLVSGTLINVNCLQSFSVSGLVRSSTVHQYPNPIDVIPPQSQAFPSNSYHTWNNLPSALNM